MTGWALVQASDAAILADIKRSEGWPKYTNRKTDLGGPTKGGITLDTFRTWRKNPRLTAADLQKLTESEADAIYRWMFMRPFDMVPDPLRHYMIDLGVLRGPFRATTMLQEIVGTNADGWIGPQTIAAVEAFGATTTLIMIIGSRFTHIEARIRENPTQAEYRNGWRNRNRKFLLGGVVHAASSEPIPKRTVRAAARTAHSRSSAQHQQRDRDSTRRQAHRVSRGRAQKSG